MYLQCLVHDCLNRGQCLMSLLSVFFSHIDALICIIARPTKNFTEEEVSTKKLCNPEKLKKTQKN